MCVLMYVYLHMSTAFFLTFFFFSENIDKEDILIAYQEAQKDFF